MQKKNYLECGIIINTHGVSGDVTAGGNVTCDQVYGSVEAGGSVACDSVGGNVSAGGNVTCDAIGGSVSTGGRVLTTWTVRVISPLLSRYLAR